MPAAKGYKVPHFRRAALSHSRIEYVIELQYDLRPGAKLTAALIVHPDPWTNASAISIQDSFS
jgi:hypothetical protein